MTINKFYAIIFIILFATACEKKIDNKVFIKAKETVFVQTSQTVSNIPKVADNKDNAKKSFVISYGSGCAMTYNVKNIVREKNNQVKVDFIVENYLDELLQNSDQEIYVFYFDSDGKLLNIKKEGEDGSFLETQIQDAQDSFKEFAASLMSSKKIKTTGQNSFIYDKTINPKTVKYDLIDIFSIKNLKKFSCDEKKARVITLPNKGDVRLLLVPQDCGDFDYRYYLLTIKNNVVVSNLHVEGVFQEPDDAESKEITTFKIDNNFNIIVTTKYSDSTKTKNYKISEDGKIF
ncbi:hypothetical protein [Halpernia frigidisoli]|uniref:Lipoprotein n=1 Tax=Halpernia frigidisoli TaxID=1125876 RepID=A0A1I3IPV6_9FLAO|nr:hypothetical protein [Halpernia frigidisoli]SFI49803.1 hypothetical protein SAMN05443292_2720 [Halpernia frigidisoli]